MRHQISRFYSTVDIPTSHIRSFGVKFWRLQTKRSLYHHHNHESANEPMALMLKPKSQTISIYYWVFFSTIVSHSNKPANKSSVQIEWRRKTPYEMKLKGWCGSVSVRVLDTFIRPCASSTDVHCCYVVSCNIIIYAILIFYYIGWSVQ